MSSFETILSLALSEDLADNGDVTSRAIFTDEWGQALLVAKSEGVMAGREYFTRTFKLLDDKVKVVFFKKDGDYLMQGDNVARIEGPVRSLLEAERTAINFIAFLSGIATATWCYVQAMEGETLILDTRKTLPGYRELSKYAVKVGGGKNHRMGLYDMVMIKDNHIDAAGSISEAVRRVRNLWGKRYKVEVETRNIREVKEAINADVDVIMLDNMDLESCHEVLLLDAGKVFFEASGNMNIEKAVQYSKTGVHYISVGAITHSSVPMDYSMKIQNNGSR